MDLQIKDKTAFISGSTAGIGLATAKAFLAEGAEVIINGRSDKSVNTTLERLKQEFPKGKISGIPAQFDQKKEVKTMLGRLPKVDILINNVGIYKSRPFKDTPEEDWYEQFEVNVMSGVRLSQHCLPGMLDRNWGRILFVSSECASLVPTDMIPYSTTKASLLAISRGLAQLTKGSEVTVNTVLPGSTLSEGADQFLENLAEKEGKTKKRVETEFFESVRTSSLLQRFAKVEEVAAAMVYLSSPLAAATNGSVLKTDGGSVGGIL